MTAPMTAPLVISHRGRTDAGGPRENTLDAFRAAVALGADGVEMDVRQTADGALVLHHDPTIAGVPIGRVSLGDVRAAGRRAGYEVPTLGETLTALPASAWLDVEIKEPGYEAAVLAAVTAARPAGRAVVTSFRPGCIAALRKAGADVPLGLLVAGPGGIGALVGAGGAAAALRAHRAGADFLAPHWRLAYRGGLTADDGARSAWVWTVNSPRMLRRLLTDPRVAAVITDRPALAMSLRAEATAARGRSGPRRQGRTDRDVGQPARRVMWGRSRRPPPIRYP